MPIADAAQWSSPPSEGLNSGLYDEMCQYQKRHERVYNGALSSGLVLVLLVRLPAGIEMLNDDPVTLWIDELRAADEDAAQKLWNHFVNRLYVLARNKLGPRTRRVYDEADAAQSAFRSFCLGVSAGRFPDLQDRAGLWRLLLTITSRKVARQHERDHRQRRDVKRCLSDYIFNSSSGDSLAIGVGQCASREPTPEFAAEFA